MISHDDLKAISDVLQYARKKSQNFDFVMRINGLLDTVQVEIEATKPGAFCIQMLKDLGPDDIIEKMTPKQQARFLALDQAELDKLATKAEGDHTKFNFIEAANQLCWAIGQLDKEIGEELDIIIDEYTFPDDGDDLDVDDPFNGIPSSN